jgi:hypothetical protein
MQAALRWLPQMSGQEVSLVLAALTRLDLAPSPHLLSALLREAAARLQSQPSTAVGGAGPGAGSPTRPVPLQYHSRQLSPQGVALVLHAVATMPHVTPLPRAVLDTWLHAASVHMPRMGAQEVSLVIRALTEGLVGSPTAPVWPLANASREVLGQCVAALKARALQWEEAAQTPPGVGALEQQQARTARAKGRLQSGVIQGGGPSVGRSARRVTPTSAQQRGLIAGLRQLESLLEVGTAIAPVPAAPDSQHAGRWPKQHQGAKRKQVLGKAGSPGMDRGKVAGSGSNAAHGEGALMRGVSKIGSNRGDPPRSRSPSRLMTPQTAGSPAQAGSTWVGETAGLCRGGIFEESKPDSAPLM